MPIQRTVEIDISSERVCDFLRSHSPHYSDYRRDDLAYDFNHGEYEEVEPATELPPHLDDESSHEDARPTRDIDLYTTRESLFEVYENRRVNNSDQEVHIDSATVSETVVHPVTLSSTAHLWVRRAVTAERRAQIEGAFRGFRVGSDDIEELESALNADGQSIDFFVFLSWQLERRPGHPDVVKMPPKQPPEIVRTQEEAMRAALPEWRHLRQISSRERCGAPTIVFPDVIPVSNIDDPLEELASGDHHPEHRREGCLNLMPTAFRVATLLEFLETDTRMEMVTIRIGRCRLGKTKLPRLYYRWSKYALYAYIVMPDTAVQHYKNVVSGAVKDALRLIPNLVWMVVTADLAGARTAFKEFANNLLDKVIPSDIRKCFVPELDVVTERPDWKRAW